MHGSHEALSHRIRTKIVRTRDLTHGYNKEPQGLYAKCTVARTPWIARIFDRMHKKQPRVSGRLRLAKKSVKNRTVNS